MATGQVERIVHSYTLPEVWMKKRDQVIVPLIDGSSGKLQRECMTTLCQTDYVLWGA